MMTPRKKWLIAVIILLLLLVATAVYILATNKKTNVCQIQLGCESSNAQYVGSINSDKYYICDCHYSKRIKPENIICFDSDEEAINQGYTKVDC